MIILEGNWIFHEKINFLATDDLCFGIQKCKENVKDDDSVKEAPVYCQSILDGPY